MDEELPDNSQPQCEVPQKPTQDEITGAKWYSIGFLIVLLALTVLVIMGLVSIWRSVLG